MIFSITCSWHFGTALSLHLVKEVQQIHIANQTPKGFEQRLSLKFSSLKNYSYINMLIIVEINYFELPWTKKQVRDPKQFNKNHALAQDWADRFREKTTFTQTVKFIKAKTAVIMFGKFSIHNHLVCVDPIAKKSFPHCKPTT